MADKKETKIIVKTSDELSDIVEKITKSDADRIILTFTEPSDLLISSINLTVIKESAQEESKSVITQIIKNPTGERNSQKAGLITINTPTNPTEDLWEKAEQDIKEVQIEKEEKLGQRIPKEDIHKEEPPKSSFQKKIDEALSKSQAQPTSNINKTKFVEEEGVKISLDSEITEKQEVPPVKDIPEKTVKEASVTKPIEIKPQQPSMTGQDIRIKTEKPKEKINIKEKLSNIFKSKKKPQPDNVIKMTKKFPKKLILLGSIGLVLVLIIGGGLYYYFAPLVKVKIYVDSKPVSIEKTFTGSLDTEAVDLEEQLVPLIKEEVEQDASSSITPTGKSVTGEKATGTVRINYLAIGETLSIPAGSTLTASSLKFVSLADLNMVGPNWTELSVEAADYGSEYNVAFETYFTIDGQDDTEVSGSALADFSGGSKTEVTVLSQADVDAASESLAKTAKEDAEGDLLDKHIGDGWEVVQESIKSTVDEDSVETDVAIGSEATTANISLSVSVSALYYKKDGIEDLVSNMLSEEAKNKNLFETSEDVELELADEVDAKYTVTGSKEESIKVKLEASGVVTPKISKDEIVATLKGMKWGEGIKYLTEFDYSDEQIQIGFEPSIFPEWIRYFPSRQGRVLITPVYVEE
jgi:hypothetical protein